MATKAEIAAKDAIVAEHFSDLIERAIQSQLRFFEYQLKDEEKAKEQHPVKFTFRGRQVKLHSGKALWRTAGHARSALRNQVTNRYRFGAEENTRLRQFGLTYDDIDRVLMATLEARGLKMEPA